MFRAPFCEAQACGSCCSLLQGGSAAAAEPCPSEGGVAVSGDAAPSGALCAAHGLLRWHDSVAVAAVFT